MIKIVLHALSLVGLIPPQPRPTLRLVRPAEEQKARGLVAELLARATPPPGGPSKGPSEAGPRLRPVS